MILFARYNSDVSDNRTQAPVPFGQYVSFLIPSIPQCPGMHTYDADRVAPSIIQTTF